MSAQDDVEKVLRSLHVMLSKSEPVKGAPGKVAINKQDMIHLLTELNKGIYAMMDAYELTTESRGRAEREFHKQGEDIIRNANHQAEDIYAASVMYTDEALNHVQELMRMSSDAIQNVYKEMQQKIRDEVQTVRTNQLELKSQLQDLKDTDKYLKLIEDRNREIEREKERTEGRLTANDRASIYANRMTEIRVNKDQLAKLGIASPGEEEAEETKEAKSEKNPAETAEKVLSEGEPTADEAGEDNPKKDAAKEAEVRVNLDADYFRWKEEQSAGREDAKKKSSNANDSEKKKSKKKFITAGWHS
jgi:hypothetical protein